MNLRVSSQDLVVLNGGGTTATTGHQSHYPIWFDENGLEYLYMDGHTAVLLSNLVFNSCRRETVNR